MNYISVEMSIVKNDHLFISYFANALEESAGMSWSVCSALYRHQLVDAVAMNIWTILAYTFLDLQISTTGFYCVEKLILIKHVGYQ